MLTKNYQFKYLEWHSPEEIHKTTLQWQSELEFIQTELHFLNEIVLDYDFKKLTEVDYQSARELVSGLGEIEASCASLIPLITKHRNDLEVLVDGVDEFEKEKAFKDRHLLLELKMEEFLKGYRGLKATIFAAIQLIIKEKKNNDLKKTTNL